MSQNCNKCKKCKSDCGYKDDVLKTSSVCPGGDCYDPEKCPETFSTNCIVWDRDTIADLGITKGMNLGDIIQRLIGVITNSGCNYPTDPCSSVIGFQSLSVAKTTATVVWTGFDSATGFQVEYRLTTSPAWLGNPETTNTYDSIGPLLPNTEYYIRIKSICGDQFCYSTTILIKTKPN